MDNSSKDFFASDSEDEDYVPPPEPDRESRPISGPGGIHLESDDEESETDQPSAEPGVSAAPASSSNARNQAGSSGDHAAKTTLKDPAQVSEDEDGIYPNPKPTATNKSASSIAEEKETNEVAEESKSLASADDTKQTATKTVPSDNLNCDETKENENGSNPEKLARYSEKITEMKSSEIHSDCTASTSKEVKKLNSVTANANAIATATATLDNGVIVAEEPPLKKSRLSDHDKVR